MKFCANSSKNYKNKKNKKPFAKIHTVGYNVL